MGSFYVGINISIHFWRLYPVKFIVRLRVPLRNVIRINGRKPSDFLLQCPVTLFFHTTNLPTEIFDLSRRHLFDISPQGQIPKLETSAFY